MYLPHLDDEVRQAEGASGRKRGYDNGDGGPCVANGGREVRARMGSIDAGAGVPHAEAQRAEKEGTRTIVERQPRDRAENGERPAGAAIRGRDDPPGPNVANDTSDPRAAAAARIRGHDPVPGTAGGDALSRARQRLAARHSLLAQSLADHAERVDRRSRDGGRVQQPTAAERMAALRRRLAERQAAYDHGASVEVDGATQLQVSSSSAAARDAIGAPSIEDAKIHFEQKENVAGEFDARARTAQAPAAAASFVAWHSAATTAPTP